jgi:hypothetical protein
LRQIVAVFPRRVATVSMARAMLRFGFDSESDPAFRRKLAVSTVPAHVRKSFAVNSSPETSRRYAFTSADPMG